MTDQLQSKPRLIPVNAPWAVAPSTPRLRLYASEMEEVHVTFIAFFGVDVDAVEALPARDSDLGRQILVVSGDPPIDPENKAGEYQRVKVTFVAPHEVRLCGEIDDGKLLDWTAYDLTAIEAARGNLSFKEYHKKWRDASQCPDPALYEVQNSPLLSKQGGTRLKLKHYLVAGDEAYVEVTAQGWSWESEGSVIGPW